MTQLAPEQFPGNAIKTRQVFVYRFPASTFGFEIAADRIQPEIGVSETVVYQLAETDRHLKAAVELDIREAPVREFDLEVPEDYSVVSVTGAAVGDYVVATVAEDGRRNLKVIFSNEVSGRQLINLNLEKNEPAAAGDWVLPQLAFPDVKSVRGDIGVAAAPGFRIAIGATNLLVEKPLSYFPTAVPNLQQAFRIREPGWSATMKVEVLEKSVQSDVFHLYSLSEGTAFGSVLVNYSVTGSPVSEWKLTVPASLENVLVEGKDVRTFRRDDDVLTVTLHQPVIGGYTLLVTFEERIPAGNGGELQAGLVAPAGVQGERGFIQIVSPIQVKMEPTAVSDGLLSLNELELPAEFQLLSSAPSLGVWQYTERPFGLSLAINWYEPGTTVTQVVEFSDVRTRVSPDGELVTDLVYYVKSRGSRALHLKLPNAVRLWAVSVNGRSVTARESGDVTLVPLPGGVDPNVPVEVLLRLGKPAVDGGHSVLALPTVDVPVLKTEWEIVGDEERVLVPSGGTVDPSYPVLRPSGFNWVARSGLMWLSVIAVLTFGGAWLTTKRTWVRVVGLILVLAGFVAATLATLVSIDASGNPSPLQLSLPILAAGESVALVVRSVELWQVDLSWIGLILIVAGLGALAWSFRKQNRTALIRTVGAISIAVGLLIQRDGAPWFFGVLAAAILLLIFVPRMFRWFGDFRKAWKNWRNNRKEKKEKIAGEKQRPGTATAAILVGGLMAFFSMGIGGTAVAGDEKTADIIEQEWKLDSEANRATATGKITVSGKAGDEFILLRTPAVLTEFEGDALRLTKQEIPGVGLTYIVTIPKKSGNIEPVIEDPFAETPIGAANRGADAETFQASFAFQMEVANFAVAFPVPTGPAAVQKVELSYDKGGWEFVSANAMKTEVGADAENQSSATILLAPRKNPQIILRPKARDMTAEETQFYVETSNVYVPGPGVVEGRHKVNIRPSQGLVSSLKLQVPDGLTVGAVNGPVGEWQFDADAKVLSITVEPAHSAAFSLVIETQRGLDPLPIDVNLAPLTVTDAAGEVGLVALAFGPDAQPEKVESTTMSAVNLGDFDASILLNKEAVLHQVFRYGSDAGELAVQVAPVAPEVRVLTKQALSLGDERIVLSIQCLAEITRAGLFQLSFPLPDGMEVDSLTGPALHHWSELSEEGERTIILHLNGKTIGAQEFALTLTAATPAEAADWEIPRFFLKEATRQTGELVIRPATGLRLNTVSRQNVSELDPRALGGETRGALAFRLLQRDWTLVLGIEKLDPRVTGSVLHEITLREGQTKTNLMGGFKVENASIRSLQIALPGLGEDEIKTLRASGKAVSDLVRIAPESDVWELQFKRRIVGEVDFRIEYDRRGERAVESESLSPVTFPEARQMLYHYALRVGGRLELEVGELPAGWQRVDWNVVPESLREVSNRTAPVVTLRAVTPDAPLAIQVQRHSLAEALKLRVAGGVLTTVLSPTGDELTLVDLTMEVIQRSGLTVGLPAGGELFSIFVNGESVNTIRQSDSWQFHILPGADNRTANVRFVYSVPGEKIKRVGLSSPELDVPLENIRWNVLAPKGFELTDHEGNLQLIRQQWLSDFHRQNYLEEARGSRQEQAQRASQLLEQANQLLQAGEQTKALRALNSVANQYALDAASNEDARVQLENLQTQQAVVGLNTRRQRLYLDNTADDIEFVGNDQIKQGAEANPVLQQGRLNFRPQELSQLLQGNTTEDNTVLQNIASRIVRQQKTTDPAPQAIRITLPIEGHVYTFTRPVQVAENAALELDLSFAKTSRAHWWQFLILVVLLSVMAWLVFTTIQRRISSSN